MLATISANLKQRLGLGLAGSLFLLIVIYFSRHPYFKPVFAVVSALVISGAVWEYYIIARIKKLEPLVKIGVAGSALFALAVFASTQSAMAKALPESILMLTLLTAFLYNFTKGKNPFINLAITFFGFVYLALPLSCMIYINYFFSEGSVQDGRWWMFYLLIVTKFTDIGAYACGKCLGSNKMVPYISPKKTWEGAIGGLIAGLAGSVALFGIGKIFFADSPLGLTLLQSIWLGILMAIAAQLGDLAESLLKRDAGVKDSNHLPGLGGILDILDSLVFTTPLLYIFLKIHYA